MKLPGLLLTAALAWPGHAALLTVSDGNASISVDPETVFGLSDYTVNGRPQLFEQWYWFRLSTDTFEHPLNELSLLSASATGNRIDVSLANSVLGVDLSYQLVGGLPGIDEAHLHESATLRNLTTAPLSLTWFMEADFDLNGSGGQDTISGGLDGIVQTDGTTTVMVLPGVTPDAFQIAPFADLFVSLSDFSITTLDDSGNPFGPGDGTFAYQWNVLLPPDTPRTLPLDKDFVSFVSEPGTLMLLLSGFAAFRVLRRRT